MSFIQTLRFQLGLPVTRRLFFSTVSARQQHSSSKKPPQPPKPIDDSTSALDYKRAHRFRPPPLPGLDIPRIRSAEEAVTNILYNTPPPNLQPYKKYAFALYLKLESLVHPVFFFFFSLDIYSIVWYKMNLEFSHVYPVFWRGGVSTSTRWLSAELKSEI